MAVGAKILLLLCFLVILLTPPSFQFFPYTDFRAGGPLSKYLDQSHALLKGPRAAIVDMLPTDIMQEGKQVSFCPLPVPCYDGVHVAVPDKDEENHRQKGPQEGEEHNRACS
eukprot:753324-Hanusia_phi.AAC.4